MNKYMVIILSALLFTGCAGEQRAIKYYTIDSFAIGLPDTVKIGTSTPLPYVVEVLDFSIAGPYNDARIALRTDSHELQYYHYHQWAETPGAAVRYFVWRMLNEAEVFEVCQLRVAVSAPQLIVTGAVNQLERMDVGGEAGAHVNAVLQLVDVRENRILVSHDFSTFRPFPANAPMNVFAREVKSILGDEMHAFIEKIYEHFSTD